LQNFNISSSKFLFINFQYDKSREKLEQLLNILFILIVFETFEAIFSIFHVKFFSIIAKVLAVNQNFCNALTTNAGIVKIQTQGLTYNIQAITVIA
jgi:hypothetical protein